MISLSVIPAAASVEAPPMRREWVEMRQVSSPKYWPIRLRWDASWGALNVQSWLGISKKGRFGNGRACVAHSHISVT